MRERLTFANVMSAIAVFLALGGSAVALKANSVGTRVIKNDSVKGRDIGNGKVKGKDLKEATLGAREIDEAAFDLERFVKMGSATGTCNPTSQTFVRCATLRVAASEPSQALLVAGGGQRGGPNANGSCKFRVNGADLSPELGFGSSDPRQIADANGISLTAVTNRSAPVPSGLNRFLLICNETSGDVRFDTTFSVVALGGTAG